MRRILISVTLLGSAGILALLLWWIVENEVRPVQANVAPISTDSTFYEVPVSLQDYFLFDVGVTDLDADGYLDMYTTNHNTQQSLLLNDGHGMFHQNVLYDWGFGQSHDFPGYEPRIETVEMSEPGLYIYRSQEPIGLVIRSHRISNGKRIRGSLEVQAEEFRITQNSGFSVQMNRAGERSDEVRRVQLSFSVSRNGLLFIKHARSEVPMHFALNGDTSPADVFVGYQKINPTDRTFTVALRDRHGAAWTDVNDDGKMDVFFSRGALANKISKYPIETRDELLISHREKENYHDETGNREIEKGTCPGRQVAWVDYNEDDRLDLYLSCAHGRKNKLYTQNEDGAFTNTADEVGLNASDAELFEWVDIDRDGDRDLILATGGSITLFENEGEEFRSTRLASTGSVEDISVADYNNDGSFDLFIASPDQSVILKNVDGAFRTVDPGVLGIPENAYSGQWVDFDNDGLTDLHVMPHGLYRQSENGSFMDTGLLGTPSPDDVKLWESRSVWFDMNNDGLLDVLVAVQKRFGRALYWRVFGTPSRPVWNVELLRRNLESQNHWLQVQLVGSRSNRQAIGALVEIRSKGRTQVKQVGHSNGSKFSQGHYRLYFGLGGDEKAEEVSVLWPDGTTQVLKNTEADRIITIRKKVSHSDD